MVRCGVWSNVSNDVTVRSELLNTTLAQQSVSQASQQWSGRGGGESAGKWWASSLTTLHHYSCSDWER